MRLGVTLEQATKITDAVLQMRSSNKWFLPGTRERMIEAMWNMKDLSNAAAALSEILEQSGIDDPGSDPCDEVSMWAWNKRMYDDWRALSRMS